MFGHFGAKERIPKIAKTVNRCVIREETFHIDQIYEFKLLVDVLSLDFKNEYKKIINNRNKG